MITKANIGQAISWAFGLVIFAIGIINTFWGNDPLLGIGMIILSLIYYPPSYKIIIQKTRFKIPSLAKIILGAFLLWVSLGVGELFLKINLMLNRFK